MGSTFLNVSCHPPASGADSLPDSDKPALLPLGLGPCHLGGPHLVEELQRKGVFLWPEEWSTPAWWRSFLSFQRDHLDNSYTEHNGREDVTAVVIQGFLLFQLKDLWWTSRETLASYLIICTGSYIVRLSHNTHAHCARAGSNQKEAPWVLWLQGLHLQPHPHTEIPRRDGGCGG